MRCAVTALSHASPSRIKLQQHSHFVKLFLSIIMQFYAQVMCRIQKIQCNCSKIMSCAPHHEEHKKSTKYLYTCVRMCVSVLCMRPRWFSYRQQLLLIQLKEVWPRAKGETCTERREEKGGALHGRRPHQRCRILPLQLVPSSPTSKPSAQKQKVPFLVMTQP